MSDFNAADWIGREQRAHDVAVGATLLRLAALLDHDASPWREAELPPLAHWCYFLPQTRQSELAADGHPRHGDFFPACELPRRMWAGSRIKFLAPIFVGDAIERQSTIIGAKIKSGASGRMLFVTVKHTITSANGPAIDEEQDIVFREQSNRAGAPDTPADADDRPVDVARTIVPDPIQLFRFSALTYNAHRIHYDREYARSVEGYPGLVVHGPFVAMLLMDLLLRSYPMARVRSFEFRAKRPAFELNPLQLCLASTPRGADLWTRDHAVVQTMAAKVEVDPGAS